MVDKNTNPFAQHYNTQVWKQAQIAPAVIQRTMQAFGYARKFRAFRPKRTPYSIYTPYGQEEFRIFTGGGGRSSGAGTGDRLRNVPKQYKPRRKADFSLEEILDIVKEYRQGTSRAATQRLLQAALQQYGKLPRIRKETGELNYNPIYGTYRARKTWFRPYPHIHNVLDPQFYREDIKGRMRRARRDFAINQIKRISPLIDQLLEPRSTGRSGQNDQCAETIEEARRLNIPLCSSLGSGFQIQTSRNVAPKGRRYSKKGYRKNSRKTHTRRRTYYSRYY